MINNNTEEPGTIPIEPQEAPLTLKPKHPRKRMSKVQSKLLATSVPSKVFKTNGQNIQLGNINEQENIEGYFQNEHKRKLAPSHLTFSLIDALAMAFPAQEQDQLRQMIDKIISQADLNEEYFMIGHPYSKNKKHNVSQKKKQERVFIQFDLPPKKVPIVIKIDSSDGEEGQTDIIIKGMNGQVLMYFKNYDLDEIPEKHMMFIERNSRSVVVENRSSKKLYSYKSIPNIFKSRPQCVWFDYKVQEQNEQIKNQIVSMIEKSRLHCIFTQSFNAYSFDNQNFDKRIKYAKEHLAAIQTAEYLIMQVVCFQYPKLVVDEILHYLIINEAIIERKTGFVALETNATEIINSIVVQMITHLSNIQGDKKIYSSHFPIPIAYSKFCFACKIDDQNDYDNFHPDESKIKKKTKFQCKGCSRFYNTQIRLCLLCFSNFHNHLAAYMAKPGENVMSVTLPAPFNQIQMKNRNLFKQNRKKETRETERDQRGISQILQNIRQLVQRIQDQNNFQDQQDDIGYPQNDYNFESSPSQHSDNQEILEESGSRNGVNLTESQNSSSVSVPLAKQKKEKKKRKDQIQDQDDE